MSLGSASLAVLLVVGGATTGLAACVDAPAVAAARATLATACPCATTASRPVWVACTRAVVADLVATGALPSSCRGAVRRCLARSVCGQPGASTCCRTRMGATRCRVVRDPSRCSAPAGASACLGAAESCCDACAAGGCAMGTSTTSTTTSTLSHPASCLYITQPPGSCAADADCPLGYGCADGECRAGPCTVRADCPADGECVIPGGVPPGTCVCRGCGPDACPLGCRRSLVLSGCICRSEPDCPDADDVCFLGLCS